MTKPLALVERRRAVANVDAPPTLTDVAALDGEIELAFGISQSITKVIGTADLSQINDVIGRAQFYLSVSDADDRKQIQAGFRAATRKEIVACLGQLLLAFPASGKLDPMFVRTAADDIGDAEPSIAGLQLGCRKLRLTWRPEFGRIAPSISEIIDAVTKAESRLETYDGAVDLLPRELQQAIEHRDRIEHQHAAALAAEQRRRDAEERRRTTDDFPGSIGSGAAAHTSPTSFSDDAS